MTIPFDATNQTEIVRALVKQRRQQSPKLGDPNKEPPKLPPTANPKKHRVVAWRHDAKGLDNTTHDTKEIALQFARSLPWAVYYKYSVMDGRDSIEQRAIAIPEGFGIDERFNPVRLDWMK